MTFKMNQMLQVGIFLLSLTIFFSSCKSESSTSSISYENKAVIHTISEPKLLTPYNSSDSFSSTVKTRLFQALLSLDYYSYEAIPVLSTALPIITNENGNVNMEMEIRPEAKWDNGTPITAKDVEFSLKMINVPKVDNGHLKPYFEFIKDIEIDKTNPRKFTLKCGKPYMAMVNTLTSLEVIPAYTYDPEGILKGFSLKQLTSKAKNLEKNADLLKMAEQFNAPKFQREVIVGSGPYTLESWETNQRLVLKKKKDWWGDALRDVNHYFKADAEEIVYEVISDGTTAVVALKGEKVDAMNRIDPRVFVEDLQNSSNFLDKFKPHTPPQFLYSYLGMNTKHPKLRDLNTRKAMRHILDVEQYQETVFYGMAERVTSIVHPLQTKMLNKDIPLYKKDLEKAKAFLKAGGWKDSNGNGTVDKLIEGQLTELEIDFIYPNASKNSGRAVLMFQEYAKQVGIAVKIKPIEYSVFLDNLKNHNFEMYFGIWGASPLGSDPKQTWHTSSYSSGTNFVGFGTPESDILIEKLRAEMDEDKRAEHYKTLQKMIDEECVYVFINATKNRVAIHNKFKNARSSAVNPGFFPPNFIVQNVIAN